MNKKTKITSPVTASVYVKSIQYVIVLVVGERKVSASCSMFQNTYKLKAISKIIKIWVNI